MRTVGREGEIDRLVSAIRTAATTDNRPHQLIVGPRGSGKSHLLIVALHKALADEQIAERVAVAMLPEDAVEIAGYEDLLVSIIDRTLGGDEVSRDTARDLRSRHDVAGLEQAVLEQAGDRVLILVVENLDRVFRDLGERGQARLRNVTETSGRVLLLASTPLLFDAVSDHARPWYGSFDVGHLGELNAEEGRELLALVAAAAGDDALAASLDTPTGLARVRAVEHLAGGSPRMWTVLAGCMTVDLLDELVPLVEALFDELAPYYQQRLWELPGMERKLVYELCRGGAMTVTEISRATGVAQRAAATSLGRLHDAGWVRREKRAGADQRKTWYSLREPLLRHHVEYRETDQRRLPAIVGFLRHWYETRELAVRLAGVATMSVTEIYLLAALSGHEHPLWSGAWPLATTPEDLVSASRVWIESGHTDGLMSRVTGLVAEAVATSARLGADAGLRVASTRVAGDDRGVALMHGVIRPAIIAMRGEDDPMDACRRGLRCASDADGPIEVRDRIALGLLAGHIGLGLKRDTIDWFEANAVAADRLPVAENRLLLIFESTRALASEATKRNAAIGQAAALLRRCATDLGPTDGTTLSLMGRSLGLSVRTKEAGAEQWQLAEAILGVATDGSTADVLSAALISCLIAQWATDPGSGPSDEWFARWVDATRGSRHLDVLHRFITIWADPDARDLVKFRDDDKANLGELLAIVRRGMRLLGAD